ncbi:MAG: restriction endonuclease [Candidatus Helarchaeota archaeon]
MTIPNYQTIMLPLLELLRDQREHSMKVIINLLAENFNLTEEEKTMLLPSGRDLIFRNRVGWARTYLKKAQLVGSTRRGFIKITQRGLDLLNQNLSSIDSGILSQFQEFRDFISPAAGDSQLAPRPSSQETLDPSEALEAAYNTIIHDLAEELLELIKQCEWRFFEKLVMDLLLAMGYGGSKRELAILTSGSHDEGIDGLIKEDPLGLDIIAVQAKRWQNNVGRPIVQTFAGALDSQGTKKGIILTTSDFTTDAQTFVRSIGDKKIILINGTKLAHYMIAHNIGVSVINSYLLKKIDSDYFEEE